MESSTNLRAWGTSRAVRIPKAMCQEVSMDIGSAVRLSTGRDSMGPYVLLRPERSEHACYGSAPFVSMDELFAGYGGDYVPTESDWGEDVGAERMP